MINQQLLDYIKQQLSQGVAKEIISTDLLLQGWQQQDVNEAFFAAENQSVATSQSPQISFTLGKNKKTIIFIAVGALLLIGLGVGGFFLFSKTKSTFTCGSSTVQGDNGLTYGTVIGADGKCWLDRNLGATQVATSATDTASYGYYYQWGRLTDGHQISTSGTTSTNSATDIPGHANFIMEPNSPYDWRSTQNDALWQGVNGINNPCPTGWRLPTGGADGEWAALITATSITNSATAYSSSLKLPLTGGRNYSNAGLNYQGSVGYYWSSSPFSTYAYGLGFSSEAVDPAGKYSRAFGFPIRCVKMNDAEKETPIVEKNSNSASDKVAEVKDDNYLLRTSFPDLVLFPSLESLLQYKFDKSPIMIESSESLPEALRFSIPIPADNWQRMPQIAVPQGALEKLSAAVSPKGLAGGYIEVLKYDLTSEISTADWLSNLFLTNNIKTVAIQDVKNPNGFFSEALGVETLPIGSNRDPMVYRVAAYRNGSSIIAVRCGAAAPTFIDLAYYFAAATNYFKLNNPQLEKLVGDWSERCFEKVCYTGPSGNMSVIPWEGRPIEEHGYGISVDGKEVGMLDVKVVYAPDNAKTTALQRVEKLLEGLKGDGVAIDWNGQTIKAKYPAMDGDVYYISAKGSEKPVDFFATSIEGKDAAALVYLVIPNKEVNKNNWTFNKRAFEIVSRSLHMK